ncbi:FHA domain-containing protein [Oceanivirga miroungae]|uniref:FHA domain-containing protein n=1 Tax=Oceanivirga miroungae TaxID=1130046 RepID=UPI0012E93A3E|nr:FHA domain-containing protein [Oceanivirga miroungae]
MTIILSLLYYITYNRIEKALILLCLMLAIYSTYNIYLKKSLFNIKIENMFENELKKRKIEELEEIKRKDNINRIIIIDDKDNEIGLVEIKKNNYKIGKKNNKNDVDIDLKDVKESELISKEHAIISKIKDTWYLIDLNSTNGTTLIKTNNRKIILKNEKEHIQIGDIIKLNNKISILIN